MIRSLLALTALLFATSTVSAQDLPKPGPEHARLAEMAGEWDAVMDMGGQKSKCKATYHVACNGIWVTSEFEGDLGGIPFKGHGIDGYDATKKKYTAVWVDSMSTAPLIMEGTLDAAGKVLTMSGTSTGPDGQPQKFKTTTEMSGKDKMTFKMSMSQADGKEEHAFTIEYTRKK
jgi:hypothetical protein